MTVIYLDLLFMLNLIANYLLLLVSARMGGEVIRHRRFVIAAVLGACYAALPFLGLKWLGNPLCKIGSGVLMVLIAFGREKRLLRAIMIFFGASAAFGGMIWAAELFGGRGLTIENGILYSYIDIRLLLLLMILCYGVLSMAWERTFVHAKRELVPVEIVAGGRTLHLIALMDTGNTLSDPATNRPVLVAEGNACRPLLPMELPLDRPVEALERLGEAGITGFRLIPYRAVGVSSGLLLAMRTERVVAGGVEQTEMLVALSPTAVSDGGGYQALLGGTS